LSELLESKSFAPLLKKACTYPNGTEYEYLLQKNNYNNHDFSKQNNTLLKTIKNDLNFLKDKQLIGNSKIKYTKRKRFKKFKKFKENPKRFFLDSKYAVLRLIGKIYK